MLLIWKAVKCSPNDEGGEGQTPQRENQVVHASSPYFSAKASWMRKFIDTPGRNALTRKACSKMCGLNRTKNGCRDFFFGEVFVLTGYTVTSTAINRKRFLKKSALPLNVQRNRY